MIKTEKQIFKLGDQFYVADEKGQLVPYVEETPVTVVPWQAVNSILDTCKILKLSRNTLMGLINSGKLRAVKAGERRWIVPGWAIEQFLGDKQGA